MTALIPTLVLVLFLACAALFGWAVLSDRAARRDVELRVDLITKAPSARQRWQVGRDSPAFRIAGERFRSLLLTGIPYRWGVRSAPPALLGMAIVSFFGTWLFIHLLLHFSNLMAIPIALAGGFAVPHLKLRIEQSSASREFLNNFPDAVDMIVRMLRAGLPVAATMRAVAREAGAPVNSVFATIADSIDIGIPFEEALVSASEKVGIADFRFFGVAVALQRTTGGNLATTLDIMCDIIRRRRAVRLKAHAATAEVRMSAYVLGVMPFFVIAALLVVAPNYLRPLIEDPRGNIIVAIAVGMLLFAFISMREMMIRATRL